MTKRERTILVITIIVILMALLYRVGLEKGVNAFTEGREQLRIEKEKYDGYVKALRRKAALDKRRANLEKTVNIGEHSDREFTPMIERAFKSIGMNPDIRTPSYEFLYEGAKEYGRVTLRILCRGDIQKVGKMLIFFDQQLIEVNSLSLTARVDSPIIEVDATVSQIVKLTDDMKAKLKAREKARRGSRSVRPVRPGTI